MGAVREQDEAASPAVFSLVYVSVLTAPLPPAELARLLDRCRRANVVAGVTGLLLLRDGTFLHLLEGDREKVEALFEVIRVDPRHQDVMVVRSRMQDHRQFPGWSLGFGDVVAGRSGIEVSTDLVAQVVQTETEAAFVSELLDLFDR